MSNLFQNWRQRSNRPRRSPTAPTSLAYPPAPATAINSQYQRYSTVPILTLSSEFRPLFLCEPYVNSQLVKGSIKTIVVLPKYVDVNEWLALNGF